MLQHLVHHTCRYVLHHQLIHQHRLQGSDQVLMQSWQTLKQSHDDDFMLHMYLQTCEMIYKHIDFVDVV